MHLKHRSVEPGKKDKLSEEEMLAKKAEAAQRRRMQVEKATKESEVRNICSPFQSLKCFDFWELSAMFDLCRLKL